MITKGPKSKTPSPGIGFFLLLLLMTQVPLAINETLRLTCVLTTWSDYADFWKWEEIPLDSRVHYCNGGTNSDQKENSEEKK